LNHSGLWVIVVCGLLGSGDIKSLNFYCYLNKPTNKAFDKSLKMYHVPFYLQLEKFDIDEYSPHLVIFDSKTGEIFDKKNNYQYEIIQDKKYITDNYEIIIVKYLNESIYKSVEFIKSNEEGSCPSVFLSVKNLKSGKIISGWVTCGSNKYSPVFIKIDDNYSITLSKPEPKKYISSLTIIAKDGNIKKIKIQVNKPFNYQGWKLYQVSYDTNSGKFSDYSIIQAVYDPWLKVTYTGIILLIAGSFFLLIQRSNYTKLSF
jgi:hypothetical protein